MLINDPEMFVHLVESGSKAEVAFKKELQSIEAKGQRALNSLVVLERRYNDSQVDETHRIDDEVYVRLKRQYQAECQWVAERSQEIRGQLANLEDIRERLSGRLSQFNNADWRRLFTELGMTVHVHEDGAAVCHFDLPLRDVEDRLAGIVSSTPLSAG